MICWIIGVGFEWFVWFGLVYEYVDFVYWVVFFCDGNVGDVGDFDGVVFD